MEILKAIAPVIIVGIIVLFVIGRLKQKHQKGDFEKVEAKSAVTCLIPIGMLVGTATGVLIGIIFPIFQLISVSLGASIGYLFGYFAYNYYRKKANS